MNAMVNLIENQKIHPAMDSVYDLDKIQDAYYRLKSGLVFGKIAVRMN